MITEGLETCNNPMQAPSTKQCYGYDPYKLDGKLLNDFETPDTPFDGRKHHVGHNTFDLSILNVVV